MPEVPHGSLKTHALTALVDVRKRSSQWLTAFLYGKAGQHIPVETEFIQSDKLQGTRQSAPFTIANGPAYAMQRTDSATSKIIMTPNISVTRKLAASESLFLNRQPGQPMQGLLTPRGSGNANFVRDNITRQIAKDMDDLRVMADNTVEWMVSKQLQGGVISYANAATGVDFAIDTQRDPARTFSLAPFLDDIDPTIVHFRSQIDAMKLQQAQVGGPRITDAICGSAVVPALNILIENGTIKIGSSTAGVNSEGGFDWAKEWEDYGVTPLGVINNIRFWAMTQQVPDPANQVEVDLIRPKYIEFVSRTERANANRAVYYGSIPMLTQQNMGMFIGPRLARAKFIETDDNQTYWQGSLNTRPLPWELNPDFGFSVKATL